MTLGDIIEALALEVRAGSDQMDRVVEGGYVSDLLSDVIAGAKEGDSCDHPSITSKYCCRGFSEQSGRHSDCRRTRNRNRRPWRKRKNKGALSW